MESEHNAENMDSMGRRKFMENLGVIGVSTTAVQYLSGGTQEHNKEVPIVERYKTVRDENGNPLGREPVYGTIDRERYERVEATRDARESVEELLQTHYSADADIFIGMTGDDNSPNGFRLDVHVPQNIDRYEVEDLLPTELTGRNPEEGTEFNGIPLGVVKGETTLQSCDYVGEDYDTIIGGAPISSDGNAGTIAAAFYHPDYSTHGWMTAGHVLEQDGNSVYHNSDVSNSDLIGKARDITLDRNQTGTGNEVDYGFVEPTSDETVAYNIASYNYDSNDLNQDGIVPESTLESKVDDTSYTLYTQGRATCRQSGYIKDLRKHFYDDVHAIITSQDTQNGDSGGPLFHIDGSDAAIAGVIKGSWNTSDVLSTSAETIEGRTGGTF